MVAPLCSLKHAVETGSAIAFCAHSKPDWNNVSLKLSLEQSILVALITLSSHQ